MLDSCDASSAAVRAALCHTAPGFMPGLPGLTKLVSKFTQEGAWQKATTIFHSIGVLGAQVRLLTPVQGLGAIVGVQRWFCPSHLHHHCAPVHACS